MHDCCWQQKQIFFFATLQYIGNVSIGMNAKTYKLYSLQVGIRKKGNYIAFADLEVALISMIVNVCYFYIRYGRRCNNAFNRTNSIQDFFRSSSSRFCTCFIRRNRIGKIHRYSRKAVKKTCMLRVVVVSSRAAATVLIVSTKKISQKREKRAPFEMCTKSVHASHTTTITTTQQSILIKQGCFLHEPRVSSGLLYLTMQKKFFFSRVIYKSITWLP